MSKRAFKRAVGRLLLEGAIKITDKGMELTWKD
jgi:predicted RNA-binding protein (virulence factor B family)